MWSQKRKNGRYQFFERYTDYVTGLSHTISVTMDRNTPAARKAAREALSAKIDSLMSSSGQTDEMTLEELLRRYLKRKGIRETTRLRDEAITATISRVIGKEARINRLTANYVKRKLENEDKDGNPELITRIKSLFRWAYVNDYMNDITWLDKIAIPKGVKSDLRDKYLEPEELRELLNGMKVDAWRDLTEFLALSGLRIGEAIDLKRRDVTSDAIRVRSTYGIRTGTSGPPKTASSERDVSITPELSVCISRIRGRHILSPYFLTDKNHNQVGYNNYRVYLRRISERTLGHVVTPHVLRHTYTSLMAAAGVPFDVIARQLGHEDSRVTKQVYFHVTRKLKEKDAALIREVRMLS